MNYAILDDQEFYRKKLKELILSYDPSAYIETFPTAKALLICPHTFDLLLLDIELPQINGLDFAKEYRGRFPHIIYVTSHQELVYDSYYPNILGFVVKENLETRLIPTIEKAISLFKQTLRLPIKNQWIEIDPSEIVYFCICNHHIYAQTSDKRLLLNLKSLKTLENIDKFCIINRQVILNMTHIIHIRKQSHEVVLSNQEVMPVSKRNWAAFLTQYNKEGLL